MEIVKAFTENGYNNNITILGNIENPLFRASEIGDILEIHCVRSSIVDFNESEKTVRSTHTPNGQQNVTFLTEKGLYKLLFRSRKKIAVEFQNWVCEVIKELRLKGSYAIQQKLEEKTKENEKLKDDLQKKLTNTPVIYIYNTDARDCVKESILKIGITEKLHERIKPYKQTHPYGKVVFSTEIDTSIIGLKTVESWIHQLLKSHNIKNEMFNLDIEEAKYFIIHTINTLKLANEPNKEIRKSKLLKLIDHEAIVVNNMKNPNISTCDFSAQTNIEIIQETLKTENEIHNDFDKFINECCEINNDAEVSSKNIIGQYRILTKSAEKETYLKLNDYLKIKFKPIRLLLQNKSNVINGFRGIKLKEIIYKQTLFTEVERFIFGTCVFSPDAKILKIDIVNEFLDWKKRNNFEFNKENDIEDLTKYLNNCQYILKSNVWTPNGNGTGYYGLNIKTNINYQAKISSTSKKVSKIDKDGNLIDSYTTIAKSAESAGISAAKMSRNIKNKVLLNGFLYAVYTN